MQLHSSQRTIVQTYPGNDAVQCMQFTELKLVNNLFRALQEKHMPMHSSEAKQQEVQRVYSGNVDDTMISKLDEPSLEAIRMFATAGIPELAGKRVYCTTATAHSPYECACLTALQIMGQNLRVCDITSVGVVTANGMTGVSHAKPLHDSVTYDEHTPLDEWQKVSDSLFTQLCAKSTGMYDLMFHWGCISQNWLEGPNKTFVSSWQFHEEWNVLMTVAMMRHALEHLADGGEIFLKIRILSNLQTVGITTLFAHAFQQFWLICNPRQLCTFVIFHGRGFRKSTLLEQLKQIFSTVNSFTPESIFCNEIMQQPRATTIMQKCFKVRMQMIQERSTVKTAYLFCLRLIADALVSTQHPAQFDVIRSYLHSLQYDHNFVKRFMTQLKNVFDELSKHKTDRDIFLRVMQSKWMRDNC